MMGRVGSLWKVPAWMIIIVSALIGLALLVYAPLAAQAAPTNNAVGVGFVDHISLNDDSISRYAKANILVSHGYVEDSDYTVSQIKAQNPDVLALEYKLFLGHKDTDITHGIGNWDYVNGQGEDWFLHFAKPYSPATRIDGGHTWTESFYPNFSNTTEQTYFANQLVQELSASTSPWDGAFLDVIIPFADNATPQLAGRVFDEYATGKDFNDAQLAWVQAIHTAFQDYNDDHPLQHPLYLYLNTTNIANIAANDITLAKAYVDASDGLLMEDFIGIPQYYPLTRYWPEWVWDNQVAIVDYIASQGKGFVGISQYLDDTNADAQHDTILAKATLMLATGGDGNRIVLSPMTSYTYATNKYMADRFDNILHVDIGAPIGAKYKESGVWKRQFTGGMVIVNPSTSDVTNVGLGSSVYMDFATGNTVQTSVTVPHNSALILMSKNQSIFINQTPAYNGNSSYELGTEFSTSADGRITKVRLYTYGNESGQHNVRIWDASNSQTPLASYNWDIPTGTPAGWIEFSLPTPLSITKDKNYIVSVSTSTNTTDKFYSQATGVFTTPILNGNLITTKTSGVYSATMGAMPTTPGPSNSSYFRDIVFEPTTISVPNPTPPVTPSAPAPSPERIFTDPVPTTATGTDGIYELGTKFQTNVDGIIKQVRIYAKAGEGGDYDVRIWDASDNTAPIYGPVRWQVPKITADGWISLTLQRPPYIKANRNYIVSVSTNTLNTAQQPNSDYPNHYYAVTASGFAQPINNESLVTFIGSGVYSPNLGEMPTSTNNSSYYRDVVFQPSAREQNLLGNQTPASFSHDQYYELGTRLKAYTTGTITKVRMYTSASESGVHVVRIWDTSSGTKLREENWNIPSGPAGWREFVLSEPLHIDQNTEYTVSVSTSPDHYYAVAGGFSSGTNNQLYPGNGASSGVLSTTSGAMPTASNNNNYFRDVVFVPDINITSDSRATGQLPPELDIWNDAWTQTIVAKTPTAANTSNKSIKIWDNSAYGKSSAKASFPRESGNLIAQWKLMKWDDGGTNYFKLMSGDTEAIVLRLNESSDLSYQTSSGFTNILADMDTLHGKWYKVKLVANAQSNTCNVYVYDYDANGTEQLLVTSSISFKNNQDGYLDNLRFESDKTTAGTIYLDDIYIQGS